MIHKLHGHRGAGSRANTQKHAHHGNVLLCLDPKSHQISPPRWKSRWPSRWWWWWLQLGQGKVSLKYATRPYRDREGRHAIVTPLATMQIQYSFCAVVRIWFRFQSLAQDLLTGTHDIVAGCTFHTQNHWKRYVAISILFPTITFTDTEHFLNSW